MSSSPRWHAVAKVMPLLTAAGAAILLGAVPVPLAPGPQDRCSVCGMRVAPHGAWVAQILLADGSASFFDGSKCLFRFLLSNEAPPPEVRDQAVAATFVTAYYDMKPVRLEEAWFVTGSDVTGPMGPELVPLRSREEAEEFLTDHHGSSIVRAAEVTQELLSSLR